MVGDDGQLFEWFRRRGDVAALGAVFDRTAPALLRVALHLATDPQAAEDLVQATFVRAIEARDEWDGARPLLPWLCGILHNRVRRARWDAARVPDPARLPAPRPVDPARAAEHAEFDAAVDAAIAALPEVYRPVLRLHLAYGHAPAEIAHALERPPGTVRSQLARGLELLRRALPAGFAGAVALAFASGRGLAAVKGAVLGHAAAAVAAGALASAGGSAAVAAWGGIAVGGMTIVKKLAAAAALAVLAAAVWFAWPPSRTAAPSLATSAEVATPAAAEFADERAPHAATASPAARRAFEPALPHAATGSLRIRCTWADDGSPAFDIGIAVTPYGLRDGAILQRTARTGDDGTVLVADLPAGNVRIAADRGGTLRLDVVPGSVTDAALAIPAGVHVRGRVVDEDGAPAPFARIWLSERARDYCDGTFVATADAAGAFLLRSVEPERFLSATLAGKRSAVVLPVRGDVGSTVEIELVLQGEGATLHGRVVDPDGRPAAAARIQVGDRENSLGWQPQLHAAQRPVVELQAGADGAFAVHGLPHGTEQRLWVRAPGTCVHFEVVQLAVTGDTAVDVRLQRGASLAGRVTGAGGSPVEGVYVSYRSTAWYRARGGLDDFRGPDWAHYGAVTDADGRYGIADITPGTLRLRATKGELEVRGEVPAAAGATATWDPVLVPIAITGRVLDERGAPMPAVGVFAMPPRGQGSMRGVDTDAEGRFVCNALASVPHVLTFTVPGSRDGPAKTAFGIVPNGPEFVVTIPDAELPTCTITGRLVDTGGEPAARGQVRFASASLRDPQQVDVDPATGAFRIGLVRPGAYSLQACVYDDADRTRARRGVWGESFELVAHETRDVGLLQMPQTGSVVVTADIPDERAKGARQVVLEDDSGFGESPWLVGTLERGTLRIANVAPGSCRVRLGGSDGLPTVYTPVTVAAGRESAVTVAMPKGVAVDLVLSPVSEPVPIHEHFEWRRDGERFHRYWNWWEGNGERVWPETLLPGSWEVVVTSETGKQTVNRFVLGADDPPGRRIPITLP